MAINTIHIVAIGDSFTKTLWARDCLRAWENYCDRHNLNLYVQTTPIFPFKEQARLPFFERFSFIKRDFDCSLLMVDLDAMPTPDMPNVFDLHGNDRPVFRVNPEWDSGHGFYVYSSQADRFNELFTQCGWPVFGDVRKGSGPWVKPDVWFWVSGGFILLPPNVQQMFKENYSRIQRETPLWNLYDEPVWAWWIAQFSREYGLEVDTYEAWRWEPYGQEVGADPLLGGGDLVPDCHMVHLRDKKLLGRYYTDWYVVNSGKKLTLRGLGLWPLRALLNVFTNPVLYLRAGWSRLRRLVSARIRRRG